MHTFDKAEKEHKRWLSKTRNRHIVGDAAAYAPSITRLRKLLQPCPPGWSGSVVEYHKVRGKRIKTLTHPSGAVAHINESNVMLAVEGAQR